MAWHYIRRVAAENNHLTDAFVFKFVVQANEILKLLVKTFFRVSSRVNQIIHSTFPECSFYSLTLCILVDLPIHIDTINMRLTLLYFKGVIGRIF